MKPLWGREMTPHCLLPKSPLVYVTLWASSFEKILLTRVRRQVNERGLLHDEQSGFRPRLSSTLQLARLVERVNRNFDEKSWWSASQSMLPLKRQPNRRNG
jgi:hypothetical protein